MYLPFGLICAPARSGLPKMAARGISVLSVEAAASAVAVRPAKTSAPAVRKRQGFNPVVFIARPAFPMEAQLYRLALTAGKIDPAGSGQEPTFRIVA